MITSNEAKVQLVFVHPFLGDDRRREFRFFCQSARSTLRPIDFAGICRCAIKWNNHTPFKVLGAFRKPTDVTMIDKGCLDWLSVFNVRHFLPADRSPQNSQLQGGRTQRLETICAEKPASFEQRPGGWVNPGGGLCAASRVTSVVESVDVSLAELTR